MAIVQSLIVDINPFTKNYRIIDFFHVLYYHTSMIVMKDRVKYRKELVDVLALAAQSKSLLDEFLDDLLTPTELDELSARWQIVKLLQRGVPQHDVAKETSTAVATVTRGAREMRNPKGGFRQVLSKL